MEGMASTRAPHDLVRPRTHHELMTPPTATLGRAFKTALFYLLLGGTAATFIYPFLWMAAASLKPEAEIAQLTLWSPNFSLRAYRHVISEIPIIRALFNSIFVSGTITASVLVLSSMTGYALARLRFFGRDAIFGLVLFTMLIPGQLTLIPLYILIVRLGWTDTYWALIVPGMVSGMGILVFRQFFRTIPQDLVDAARIDGCGHFRILFSMFWPLSKPALITVGIVTFIGAWNDVLWPLVVIRKWEMMTMPQMVTLFQVGGLAGAQVASQMAAAMMLALPVMVAYALFQRHFIEGLALSGLKG